MNTKPYLLESRHAKSRRSAVFEDDGTSAWFYLSHPDDARPEIDVWVHNRIAAPPASEIKNYYGGPPPAAVGFADDDTICDDVSRHTWSVRWDTEGESAMVCRDDDPVAFLNANEKSGYSKNLLRNGPWGRTWEQSVFDRLFPNA